MMRSSLTGKGTRGSTGANFRLGNAPGSFISERNVQFMNVFLLWRDSPGFARGFLNGVANQIG